MEDRGDKWASYGGHRGWMCWLWRTGDEQAGYGGLVTEKQKQHKPTFIFLLYFIEILPNVCDIWVQFPAELLIQTLTVHFYSFFKWFFFPVLVLSAFCWRARMPGLNGEQGHVWESSAGRFRPDGPKVCTTDLLHDDNLYVTDVQMEDGGDQAEVKTCFSEGGGWWWWWLWLWMVQWGCAAIRQRFGSRRDCTCPMSPFGIALRLRVASVAEMDELVRRVRDDAVRPAALNLLPCSPSLHTPTFSWRETCGSKRICKAAFRGGC